MPLDQLVPFIAAGLLLNLTPGPDVLRVVTQALRGGVRAGVAAAFGVSAGCCVHILAAALGVSALLAASATALGLLKLLGAVYLVWCGLRLLLAPAPDAMFLEAQGPGKSRASGQFSTKVVFLRGFWTNALNPKVALFFLAFLPQFIPATAPDKALAFLALGLLFNANALVVSIGWALAAVWLARQAQAARHAMRWLDRVAGALFIGFGLRLGLADNLVH